MSDDFDSKPTLADLEQGGKKIAAWPYVTINKDVRLYFLPADTERCGFDFCCVENVGNYHVDGVPDGGFEHPESRYEYVLRGWAAFDGIRHLYFVGHGEGYFNYPDAETLIAALAALRKLEIEHCRDARPAPTAPENGNG